MPGGSVSSDGGATPIKAEGADQEEEAVPALRDGGPPRSKKEGRTDGVNACVRDSGLCTHDGC